MAARPKTKKPKLTLDARADGWSNELTGLGDISRDKRLRAVPSMSGKLFTVPEAEMLWRSSDMAARIVETPADELVRKFCRVCIGEDSDKSEAADGALQELHVQEKIRQALRYARAYGGAAMFLGVNDRVGIKELRKPLDESNLRSLDYLTVFDPDEARVLEWYNNPLEDRYGEPLIYQITPRAFAGPQGTLASSLGPFEVHESRIIAFNGPITSRTQRVRNFGWGDSILSRAAEVVRDFDAAWDSSAALMVDFAQAVFKMKGLADAIAGDAEGLVRKRLLMMDASRSVTRSVLIDADVEDFKREMTPASGLAELLDRWCNRLAGAARMPVTLLMGQSPAGLNATGDADIRWFYDQISSDQQTVVAPAIERILHILMMCKQSPISGGEPDSWDLEFPPLWQMNDTEKADIFFKMAQGDMNYLKSGVITPDEVAQSRFSRDDYGMKIQLDTKLRDQYAEASAAALDGAAAGTGADEGNSEDQQLGGGAPALPGAPALGDATNPTPRDQAAAAKSMADIVAMVAEGKIPPESGQAILEKNFEMLPDEAAAVIAKAGKGFKYTPPKPAVAGPGGKPGAPGAKKPAGKPAR